MVIQFVLYLHLLAATAWIGGALLLFALGLYLRDKSAQEEVYWHLGPFYGYFETIWLLLLWITGLILFDHFDLWELFSTGDESTKLGYALQHKLHYVAYITMFTIVHMVIAFRTHGKVRKTWQNWLARGSALLIFFLNLGVLWFAIQLREILSL